MRRAIILVTFVRRHRSVWRTKNSPELKHIGAALKWKKVAAVRRQFGGV